MQVITGGCHCGNLHIQLDWPSDARQIQARACTCSFCTRHAAVYTSHPKAQLRIRQQDPEQVQHYRFARANTDFLLCRHCGVLCLAYCTLDGQDYAVVNTRCFSPDSGIQIESAPSNFSEEDDAARIERRKKYWIGSVRFEDAR